MRVSLLRQAMVIGVEGLDFRSHGAGAPDIENLRGSNMRVMRSGQARRKIQ